MLLFITHKSSKSLYPNNKEVDFVYELKEEIQLIGDWTVSLIEIFSDSNIKKPICVYCDIIEPSSAFGESRQLLRIIKSSEKLSEQQHRVTIPNLKRILFSLRETDDLLPNLTRTNLVLVLKLNKAS